MSDCTHALVAEPIYLRDKLPKMSRRIIAEIAYCYKCNKAKGCVRSLGSPKIQQEDWANLVGVHPHPQFVLELRDGKLLPEGMDLIAFERSRNIEPGRRPSVSPQELAANDHIEEEPEVDYEG